MRPLNDAHYAQELHDAVWEDHPCEERHCDIAEALRIGLPEIAAAWLQGATNEHPALDAYLERTGDTIPHPYASKEWKEWEDNFYGSDGWDCGCGAHVFQGCENDTCPNCLANRA